MVTTLTAENIKNRVAQRLRKRFTSGFYQRGRRWGGGSGDAKLHGPSGRDLGVSKH